jgi:predicted dehydrogenase/threonine dehydrogenase-like Zn-dependent dehydrogenase
MKQILQNLKSGTTKIYEVPSPSYRPGMVCIKTKASLISPGTEKMLIEFSKGGLISKARSQPDKVKQVLEKIKNEGLIPTLENVFKRLEEPLPLGYCNVGKVISFDNELNSNTLTFGDRVVSNGPHAEVVCVPKHLCAKVPDNVPDEHAAFTVLGAVGLQGIRLAHPTLGEKFVVYGAGLIGLLTIQLLKANGCQVLAVDLNEDRLSLAKSWGAEICNSRHNTPQLNAKAWTKGEGVDGVIITASAKTDEILHQSAQMCRKRGRIVLVGVVGLNLRRNDFYEKELSFHVSCSYGPGRYDDQYEQKGNDYPIGFVRWTEQRNFQAILAAMSSGQLDVSSLITNRYPMTEAEIVYNKISKDNNSIGIILDYSDDTNLSPNISFETNKTKPLSTCVAAMIGAGNFAKMTMGPLLNKTGSRLKYVYARTNGAAAAHIAHKYGFEKATTDLDQIMADPELNTVFITTRHNSHADLICKALNAKKHVFVEKPLCIDIQQLRRILTSLNRPGSKGKLMVGFNRRFSPHVHKIKELLNGRGEPLAMNFMCNAGIIPSNVWVHDSKVGGGRIIGEACHFIDLLAYIVGSPITTVSAVQMGQSVEIYEDKMSIVLSFSDGSIGTVNYFGNGSKNYPKESMEIFTEGRILRLNNFRKLSGFGFKEFRKFKTRTIDKGHKSQFKKFVTKVCHGGDSLMTLDEMVNVTLACFAAVTSANEGRVISLEKEYGGDFFLA